MSYGIKYKLEAFARKNTDVYRVDIYEEGYAGAITYKNIGAGHLRLAKSAGIIQKTSLFISIQADTDFEFTGFFQYDNFKYKVVLNKNGTAIWSGYLISESYNEPYKNPPYDVELVATDNLGLLENYTFNNSGNQTYLAALKHCIDNTGLELDYNIAVDLYESTMSASGTLFDQLYFNGDIFEDEKCSDVIKSLLPFGATITQKNNAWLIRRPREDAEKSHHNYYHNAGALVYSGTVSGETVLTMGDLYTGGVYPIGMPLLEMQHAWRNAVIKKVLGKKESFFLNHDFAMGDDYWFDVTGGVFSVISTDSNYYAKIGGYSTPGGNKYIEQGITVEATSDDFVFECQYDAIAYTRFTQLVGYSNISVTVRIQVQLGSYYLTTEGWTTTASIMEFPIESSVGAPTWKELKIITANLPASGTLYVRLYQIEHVAFPPRSQSAIIGSVFTNIKAYTQTLSDHVSDQEYDIDLLENAVESGSVIEIKPVTLPNIDNASIIFANGNYLSGGTLTNLWENNGDSALYIQEVIAKQLDAYYGKVYHRISGCLWRGSGLHLNAISQHAKNNNRKFIVESGEWYILDDEYNLVWLEVAGTGTAIAIEDTPINWDFSNLELLNDHNGIGSSSILPDGILDGGFIYKKSNFDVLVTAARYVIGNQIYESPDTNFTLDTAHASLSRWDVLYFDTEGSAGILTGTPAADPQLPQIDPTTQLKGAYIEIPGAAAGVPLDNQESVYSDNAEWTGTANGVTVDFDSTTSPYDGTKCIDVEEISDGDYIKFSSTSKTIADYETLSFNMKLKSAILPEDNHALVCSLYASGEPVTTKQKVKFDNFYENNWQNVALSVSEFDTAATDFDEVRFEWENPNAETFEGFYIDLIELQKGIDQPIPMIHRPVTIHPDSIDYLEISRGQVLKLLIGALPGNDNHSALSNLDADDHLHYLNITRGDARYYTETELNTSGAGGAVHWNNVTNKPTYDNYVSWRLRIYDTTYGNATILIGSGEQFLIESGDGIAINSNFYSSANIEIINTKPGIWTDAGTYAHLNSNNNIRLAMYDVISWRTTSASVTGSNHFQIVPAAGSLLIQYGSTPATKFEFFLNGSFGLGGASGYVLPGTDGAANQILVTNGTGTLSWTNQPSAGVTDHGALTGLTDDDHTQYLNTTRGDARYYTETELNTSGAGGAVHWNNLTNKPTFYSGWNVYVNGVLKGAVLTGKYVNFIAGTGINLSHSLSGQDHLITLTCTVSGGGGASPPTTITPTTTNNDSGSYHTHQFDPAGSSTQVQFNDGGDLGASSNFTFNKTTGAVELDGTGTYLDISRNGTTKLTIWTSSTNAVSIDGNANADRLSFTDWNNINFADSYTTDSYLFIKDSNSTKKTYVLKIENSSATATNFAIKDNGDLVWLDNTLSSLSTGTADNDKLVTKGYVDDADASDNRLKTNIKTILNPLGIIKKLRGVHFNWRKNKAKSIGFIAQEFEQVLPELVHENSKGLKRIDYRKVAALLVEGMKEQQQQIDELKEMINNLKSIKNENRND